MGNELWAECIRFHGHACPGLAIGYRAAMIALERLNVSRSEDEEIVCVAENEACGVDAVQVVTSCTAGKGNLIFRPAGKTAYSFFCRSNGKGLRVASKPFDRSGGKEEIVAKILKAPADDLFEIKEPHYGMPEKARMFESVECSNCGEYSREDKMRLSGKKLLCFDCYDPYNRG